VAARLSWKYGPPWLTPRSDGGLKCVLPTSSVRPTLYVRLDVKAGGAWQFPQECLSKSAWPRLLAALSGFSAKRPSGGGGDSVRRVARRLDPLARARA